MDVSREHLQFFLIMHYLFKITARHPEFSASIQGVVIWSGFLSIVEGRMTVIVAVGRRHAIFCAKSLNLNYAESVVLP